METKKESMKRMAVWGVVSLLIIAVCLLVSVSSVQAETVKYQTTFYHNKVEVIPVGDVEGHVLIVVDSKGLYLAGNEVAVRSAWTTGDVTKGKGLVQGYEVLTYEDGSTIVSKYQVSLTPGPGGKIGLYQDGKGEYTKGTGRFEGIKGTYTFTGKRLTPVNLKENVSRGDVVYEGTATYTLPPKK